VIGVPGGEEGHGQHNPGFHGVPSRTPRERGFECALGVRHGGGALTCGELDFGTHPAATDLGSPPGILGSGALGEPAGGGEPAQGEVVGGQAEQGVGSRPGGVEAVRVRRGFQVDGLGEGLAVESTGLAVAAQLPPV
jgi:hypothetical protein